MRFRLAGNFASALLPREAGMRRASATRTRLTRASGSRTRRFGEKGLIFIFIMLVSCRNIWCRLLSLVVCAEVLTHALPSAVSTGVCCGLARDVELQLVAGHCLVAS